MYHKTLFALGALMLALTATASHAKAAEQGAICIQNPTSIEVHYQFKWGNGEWVNYTVQPGQTMMHWHPLDSQRCTPIPQIRFDYILGDGMTTFKYYDLQTYGTFDVTQGKPYSFSISPGGLLLDLYAND